MITASQAAEIRTRSERNKAFTDTKRDKSGWASYSPDEVPLDARMTNEERSALEVYDFVNDPPARYFLYIDDKDALRTIERHGGRTTYIPNGSKGEAITWIGDVLGTVTFGQEYRSNFGDRRVPVTIDAINGRTYTGVYYRDSGNYARVKLAKSKRVAA